MHVFGAFPVYYSLFFILFSLFFKIVRRGYYDLRKTAVRKIPAF